MAKWTKFEPKLERLIVDIDNVSSKDHIISLVGTSAGGSAILNAFYERSNKIHKVVNICGRINAGVNVFPSLELASVNSPAFKESVLLFERCEQLLMSNQRAKILTIRALFDEIVPTSTITLAGAKNIQIFSIEHTLSIALAMTIYKKLVIEFLQSNFRVY